MLYVSYDPIEYWVLIPKFIEILLFTVLAIKINRLKDYVVNKLYFAAFLIWAAYILINSIIYLMAANSETAFLIATILHKIALSCAIIFSFLIYTSTLVIKDGHVALKQRNFIIGAIAAILISIVAIITQGIEIVDQNGIVLNTESEWVNAELIRVAMPINLLTSFLVIVPFFFCGFAIYFLTKIMKNSIDDKLIQRQMNFLLWGIALIPIGMIYFIFIQLFAVVNIVTATLGHLIWTLSPILVWKSRA